MSAISADNRVSALNYMGLGFSIIPVNADKTPLIKWQEYQSRKPAVAEIEQWWTEWPEANIGIVTGAVSGIVVVDVEAGGPTGNLPPTVMSKTGGGGLHFYYRHPGREVKNGVRVRELTDIRGDGGYVVAPPSLHQSGNRYEWIVKPGDADFADLPEWVLEYQTSVVKPAVDLAQVFVEKVTEGSRNNAATQLAGKLLHELPESLWELAGFTAMEKWNSENCQPPLETTELLSVWASIKEKETQVRAQKQVPAMLEQPKPSEWKLWTAGSILDQDFGEDEWLIESLLLKPGLMALSGNPGDFKTALALHFALCVSRGLPVFNRFPTKQGTVLMVDEENHLRHIKKRLEALGMTQADPILYLSQNGFKVDAPVMLTKLMELVKEHNVQFVTLDSFVDVHGQEENDSGGMQKVMSAMRQIVKEGVSVLFLHHPSKQVGFTPRKGGQNLRGSSNILAQVDTHMHVQKKEGEEALVLRHEKMRDAAKQKPFEVQILLDGPAPTGFQYSDLHDEKQNKAEQAAEAIAEILNDGVQSRPQLHEMLASEYGKGAIDDGIKQAEEMGHIERVPKDELPNELNPNDKRKIYYRKTLEDELQVQLPIKEF